MGKRPCESENNRLCGIYLIRCRVTGNGYVGQSTDICKRMRYHRRNLDRGWDKCPKDSKPNYPLSKDYSLYGAEAFDVFVLSLCDVSDLDKFEDYWIIQKGFYNVKKPDGSADSSIAARVSSADAAYLLTTLDQVVPMPWPVEALASAHTERDKQQPLSNIGSESNAPKPVIRNPPVVKFIVVFLVVMILVHLCLVSGMPPLLALALGMILFSALAVSL